MTPSDASPWAILASTRRFEDWVVKMATENSGWDYDCIAGTLTEFGYDISEQMVPRPGLADRVPPSAAHNEPKDCRLEPTQLKRLQAPSNRRSATSTK